MSSPLLLVGQLSFLLLVVVNAQQHLKGMGVQEDVQRENLHTTHENSGQGGNAFQPTTSLPVDQTIIPQQQITALVHINSKTGTNCFWSGTAPFCQGHCGRFYDSPFVDKMGDGKKCWFGIKKYCCPKHVDKTK